MTIYAAHNKEEISRIYHKYAHLIYRIIRIILKNDQETEDIVQNVFVKLIKSDKKFTGDEHIKAWLILCAKNEAKNLLKHPRKRKTISIELMTEIQIEDKYNLKEVQKYLLMLNDKYRIPIYLYYYRGYSTQEISKILKVNHSTIRGRLKTARDILKSMIKSNKGAIFI